MYSNQQFQNQQPQQQQYAQQSPQPNYPKLAMLPQQPTAFYPGQQPHIQQQQIGFPLQQNLQSGVGPTPTGFSYQSPQFSQQQPAFHRNPQLENENSKTGPKIPNVRLSFLTADDQGKFEQLFRVAVGSEVVLSGEKAREILLRSKLSSGVLSKIWYGLQVHYSYPRSLSDTTKSGALYFPEFCLAMSLCNKQLTGRGIPDTIDEKTLNEVSSLVDIISFAIEDNMKNLPLTNAPSFEAMNTTAQLQIQHSIPQHSIPHSIPQHSIPQQPQFPQPHFAIQPLATGFQPQSLGFGFQPQSFSQNLNLGLQPLRPQFTNLTHSASATPNLAAQPTGQWGFVNAPAGGLPGIDALQARLMPQAGREGGFSVTGLQGNATIPWAITKEEKIVYDQIFKAWDGMNKGFIDGPAAIEIFGQSGLPRSELEKVWTLADPQNRGKLNTDEFAISLHLIYRNLNGYDIPARLPQELIPPSWRNISDSVNQVKNMLRSDASRKITPISQLGLNLKKNQETYRKGATYRNDDTEIHYKSSARRRGGGRTPSPAISETRSGIEALKKRIHEKEILLESIDTRDQENIQVEQKLEQRDRDEADYLYKEIRRIQEEIDRLPSIKVSSSDRSALKKRLQSLDDKIPTLVTSIRKIEEKIADSKIELFHIKDSKAHPNSIVGSGSDADRRKAKAAAMLQSRMAALTGQNPPTSGEDSARRLEEETERIKREKERNGTVIREIDESANMLRESIQRGLESDDTEREEDDRKRWEDGLGVDDQVKSFILELQRGSLSRERQSNDRKSNRYQPERGPPASSTRRDSSASDKSKPLPNQSVEDRVAWVKAEAQRRMNERLAALGIKPVSQRQASPPVDIPLDPVPEKKKPAPPPARKSAQPKKTASRDNEREAREKTLKAEQEAQEAQHFALEDQSRREEEELLAQKTAQEERLRRLEAQVRQGKSRKADEAKHRAEVDRLAKEREEKLCIMRAEIETRKQEEMNLQRERELLLEDDNQAHSPRSDDTETPVASVKDDDHIQLETTAPAPTQTNPFLNMSAATPRSSGASVSLSRSDSNNPFFKLVGGEAVRPPITGSGHLRADSGDDWSVMRSDDGHSSTDDEDGGFSAGRKPTDLAAMLFGGMGPPRKSSAPSKSSSPTASGPPLNMGPSGMPLNMGPSGMNMGASSMPLNTAPSGIPPPPPLNTAPSGIPPLPPVAPSLPPLTLDRSALLNAIQAGKGLKKVQTIDKSAAIAGRVCPVLNGPS
ncbi:Actin cytoskeleton-regulatory complex protein pan1 [Neolecta irregularis DAH-3]|uniref:Actin cytoskeleton-regulatory complex protein pan1 n=1 Tax=Neolecta irregularis (strain DAH-3) TaxID=1198029 RepID=A0A1U7LWW6_NEOID|nr:Actin cytoskeleton-regulatory complex protein pan1 [Neolecta irregularis DAH-3]|eukprot:OLL27170.1 Actin cytoskeleton-regulatory complex protein pan1 [Neolecta irregularis DAH-3]